VNKLLTRLIVENWRAKLMSLIVAAAVWYLIKKNQDTTVEGWPALPEYRKGSPAQKPQGG
jgi:hypothetical protein